MGTINPKDLDKDVNKAVTKLIEKFKKNQAGQKGIPRQGTKENYHEDKDTQRGARERSGDLARKF